MSIGKSLVAFLAICYLAVFIVGCTGDKGPTGPPGFPGQEGPPGANRGASPISDRTFGILIANSTASDFVGAPRILLTSDTTAVPGADKVVARAVVKAPVIDGIDNGTSEWDNAAVSAIALESVAGADNGITEAQVRAAYDRSYIYIQVKWTEANTGTFVPAADVTKNQWTYNSESSTWTQSGGEDQLIVGWNIGSVTGWDASGIRAIFDGTNFRTAAVGETADLWTWQSTVTNYSGYLADEVVHYAAAGNAAQYDVCTEPAFTIVNTAVDGHPIYMKSGTTGAGSQYPLRSFEYTKFADPVGGWHDQATIPGYLMFTPNGSVADVLASSSFSDGTWTVELRRLRMTGNGDDVIF
jgi:hypothetical protein